MNLLWRSLIFFFQTFFTSVVQHTRAIGRLISKEPRSTLFQADRPSCTSSASFLYSDVKERTNKNLFPTKVNQIT